MINKNGRINILLVVIVYIILGLVLGLVVGGYAGWKNKKIKEQKEQPLQAIKTKEQKEKEISKQKSKKEEKVSKPAEVKEWRVFENKEYKYKIQYPENWFISSDSEESPWLINLTSYDPKNIEEDVAPPPGVRVEILVQGNPRNLNLKDWIEEGHQFSGNPKNVREMKISDLDAIWEELDFMGPTINVTIMRANDVFTISYTGQNPDYQNYLNVFDKIVEGMEVENYEL